MVAPAALDLKGAAYEYEPDEGAILAELLPRDTHDPGLRGDAREPGRILRRPDDARWTTPPATRAT